MARVSLDTSRLPADVLTYTNSQFFDFIQNFCGKDEADLLSIQAIRSVDSLISTENLYTIFALDSEDLDAIQKRCGFKNRNGTCSVRPGIKSTLDYVTALLKRKEKETNKMKKIQLTLNPTTTSITSSNSIISSSTNNNNNVTSFISKKTEAEHRDVITKYIEEWCIQQRDELKIPDFKFVIGVDYYLQFNQSLDKAEIKCLCGLLSTLSLSISGNFKVKLFF
jgi:hypothetical protein